MRKSDTLSQVEILSLLIAFTMTSIAELRNDFNALSFKVYHLEQDLRDTREQCNKARSRLEAAEHEESERNPTICAACTEPITVNDVAADGCNTCFNCATRYAHGSCEGLANHWFTKSDYCWVCPECVSKRGTEGLTQDI
jgi:hypothetical protein